MILGQVICLLLISIVTSQDYTLENTQSSENPKDANINNESQNEQVSTSSTNPQNSEMQSDADQFLSSIQNSDELKNALSDQLKSLEERDTSRIETAKDFSPENSMENTELLAKLEVPKQKRDISSSDVQSQDYKFEESELDALKELTDKLRSGVSFPISKSYMKILCKFCTKLSCRPKCVDDSHCHSQMACVDGSCIHICSERIVCGKNTDCLMVNHKPVCKCKPGFTGNPNFFCKPITGTISDQGCSSNHACKCSSNNECPENLACIKGICIDICLMRVQCGRDAICRMLNHEATCSCKEGYTGDPLSFCHLTAFESPSLCPPNSCGPNTLCKVVDDTISCKCLPNYVGNPWKGCRLRCRRHNECKDNEACVENICRSACKLCGKNAICEAVNNHRPMCKCPTGYFGNPYKECVKKQECRSNIDCPKPKPVCKHFECENPCGGSCGINALCIIQGDQGFCLCPEFFYGNPHILCRAPPCLPNFKCPGNLACVNDTCLDICRGSPKCGTNARCRIQANEAVCLCDPGFTGDPLISCKKIANPTRCSPNSCGPNAKCQIVSGKITCKCLPQHVGNPWIACRPGCAQHDDCRDNEACVGQTCRSACHLCGKDAMCEGVRNHRPICKCPPGYRGNPYKICIKQRECSKNTDCPKNRPICTNYECENPCTNLCGTNALCRIMGDQGVCFCREFFFGNPHIECRPPPCLPGDRCPMNLACVNDVCLDLCSKTKKCGKNAACRIQDNKPVCICYPGFTGDPLTICQKMESPEFCPPNSCGPNTQCEVINKKIVCKCLPNYIGNPWKGCQHTCTNNYDCREKEDCIGGICQDACKLCGKNSLCEELVANKPVCICRPGFTGNPYRECRQIGDCNKNSDCQSFKPVCKEYKCQNPCDRACGQGAICRLKFDQPICSCPNGYTGDPLVKCKQIEQVCRVNPCGPNTICIIGASGKPICKCLPSFVGNPWQGCSGKCANHRECKQEEICIQGFCRDSCKLCGHKAICRRVPWSKPICKCPPGFNGDPFKKCRPIGDCLTNSDCPSRKPVCKQFECQNPCLKACGIDARCRIEGVKAVCSCPNDYTGDPLVKCRRMKCRHDNQCKCTADDDCPETLSCVNQICVDLCLMGKKCGRNAVCQTRNRKAICICKPGLTGDPLVNCVRPCYTQNDCPNNVACKNNVCVDVCKKFPKCGSNAMCKVKENKAVCLCLPGFTGNPFKHCKKIEPVIRCNKSPCGPNTICLLINRKPVCKCLPNYVGNPWKGCLQKCKIHRDCKMTEICIGKICRDACLSCGIKAICQRVSWNEPICKCPVGYTGNPRKECRQIGDCITNVDCPPRKPVCKQFHCQNPCIGACGIEALCRIQGVKPICSCPQEFTGDPLVKCKRMNCRHEHECKCMEDNDCPVTLSCVKGVCVDICFLGKRCGKNAACHMRHHKAVCECEPGLVGNPLVKCEPPCYSQNDCTPNWACKNKICVDLCRTFRKCGKNALCKIINNESTCVCPPGYRGNPLKNCRLIQPVKYCERSPCGPNTICIIIQGKPFCRCLPNFYGNPWKVCYQRCGIHSECKMREICIDSICQDACTLCGKLAICERVPWHEPVCKCPPGYTGNPFEGCKRIGDCITNADCPERKPVCKKFKCQNPCIGACGIDALCHIKDAEAVCTCPPEFTGDPLLKCRRINCRHEHQCKCSKDYDCPETLSCLRGICVDVCRVGHKCGINAVCQMRQRKAICVCEAGLTGDPLKRCVPPCYSQEDCSPNLACVNSRCVDLCKKKTCGRNSVCKIVNNKAVCLCVPGFTGNPLIRCSKIEPVKVCPNSPCGPNTRCFIIKNKRVCKCLPNFVGDPWKGCRKQCNRDSVCEIHEKCIQNTCQDACKLCGVKAICQKIPMQRPICKCTPGHTGNPYQRCKLIGDCITNAECPRSKPVCKNYRCLNPCHRACGMDALCRIQGVKPVCTCPDEFTGDPLVKCRRMNCRHEHECKCTSDHDCPKILSCVRGICVDLCLAGHKCGINAVCQMRQHKAVCICEAGLTGDPLIKCVPPCYSQEDCSPNLACVNSRCVDLCKNKICGKNTVCKIVNNKAVCLCVPGFTGNPLIRCSKIEPVKVCPNSPCGPNTRCFIIKNKRVCKCLPNFVGDPWKGCRKQCNRDSVCEIHEKCIQNTCQDACKLCGVKAICQKIPMQRPICKCPPGYTGNSYKRCKLIGNCVTNADCPSITPVCKNYKCLNPCHHACGIDALCRIRDSAAVCSCPSEYTGDPLVKCRRINCRHEHECKCSNDFDCPESLSCVRGICVDVCLAGQKCGVNAVCQMRKHKAICVCEPGFTGDPLKKCVPPCFSQKDCSANMACIENRCVDLCRKKTCGRNSVCKIVNNKAVCLCVPGFTGNPMIRCSKIEPVKVCPSSPCGPNTRCLIIKNKKVCKCLPNFVGDPWKGCRQQCNTDSVCEIHEKCIRNTCQDACKLCGKKAVCQQIPTQRPICKCPPGYTGNPYKRCKLIGDCDTNADCPPLKPICTNYKCLNPCHRACGIDAVCRVQGVKAVCNCPPGFTGDPLVKCKQTNCSHIQNCKCSNDDDCPDSLSCVNGVCVDLCLAGKKCGINALCEMEQHKAKCSCKPGSSGDPLIICKEIRTVPEVCGPSDNCKCNVNDDCPDELECVRGICLDSCLMDKKCGFGARCVMQNHNANCECKPGLIGNPLVSCIEISGPASCGAGLDCKCSNDNDCPKNLACVRGICLDLCLMGKKCGFDAYCVMQSHNAVCKCKPGLTGNPMLSCNELPTNTPCGPGDNCRCNTDMDCPEELACVNGICLDLCLTGKKCGINAVCVMNNHAAVCKCKPGLTGDPLNSCNTFALNSPNRCNSSSCGPNAVCETVNNKPFCKCIPPFIGDPWVGCHSECHIDTDCSLQHVCIANHCQHACNLCVENSFCEGAVGHRAVCKCLPGFTGNPFKLCMKERECTSNSDCPHMKPFCDKFQCKNPCDNACGINALCYVKELKPRCHCPKHHIGNPYTMCTPQACTPGNCKIRCKNNRQCPKNMACSNNICINLCSRRDTCGTNAVCKMVNHQAVCQCRPGFTGNPFEKCRQFNPVQICPVSPCGPNTLCLLIYNKKVCICLANTIGNPWKGCHAECKRDHDCSNHHACIDRKCQNACKLCGKYNICTNVVQHRPICACPPNFSTECSMKPECMRNSDCPKMKPFCRNYRCENPCDGICGINALCDVGRWKPICYCPLHYTGNPLVFCKPESCLHQHECKCLNNLECPEYLSCVNGVCVDFCLLGKKCGENAICTMKYQKAICICEPGFTGNPNAACKPIELKPQCSHEDRCSCKSQQECPTNLACVKGICINVCFLGKKCGKNAICKVVDHTALCVCIPGHTGNPNRLCRPNQLIPVCTHDNRCRCKAHQECPTNLACVEGICINICLLGKKCGTNAICKVLDHKAMCVCIPGHTGNPNKFCRPNQLKPVCTNDSRCHCHAHQECPSNLACVKGICINICLLGKKCGTNAICKVLDHKAMCVCIPGHTGNPNKFCRPNQLIPVCTHDSRCHCHAHQECPTNLACVKGICINICLLGKKCGTNAICKVLDHKAMCVCIPGHTGNPNKFCRPNQLKPVCTHDSRCHCHAHQECPTNLACVKGICINICLLGKKCGTNAICKVLDHKAMCVCIPGHTGNPNKLCRPNQLIPVCTHDSRCHCHAHQECPTNLACVKGICINICLLGKKCGTNAICKVLDHKAMCVCIPGHTGNPNKLCRPNQLIPVCTHDSRCHCHAHQECPTNLACVKGICINICLLGKKCGTNAICKVLDHKAMCVCIPGHTGNPNKLCRPNQLIPVCTHDSRCHCHAHQECPTNLACVKGICINICLLGKKCGTNAICKVLDHKAMCVCIPGHTGNPNKLCRPNQLIPVCTHDSRCHCHAHQECPTNLACVKGICINICLLGKKCGTNAICKVLDHKAMCVCIPGHTGNPNKLCRPNQLIPVCLPGGNCRCINNEQCPAHLACVKSICVNLCLTGVKCGRKAVCRMHNHKPVCTCEVGYTGDPLRVCHQLAHQVTNLFVTKCFDNRNCPKHLSCVKGKCCDLCSVGHKCGFGAKCRMHYHKAVFICPTGVTGNACRTKYVVSTCPPGHRCYCTESDECPGHMACVDDVCVNLCLHGHQCGVGALCEMHNHKVVCRCRIGFTGNPLQSCQRMFVVVSHHHIATGFKCSRNIQCRIHQACVKGICVDLCMHHHKCGVRAKCRMHKHKAVCRCRTGFIGNSLRICKTINIRIPRKSCLPGVECKCSTDKNCPEHLACVNGICTDLCILGTKCGKNAICNMQNNKVQCTCAPGFTGDPFQFCTQIDVISACLPGRKCKCSKKLKCPTHLACVNGICVDLCTMGHKCGVRAICTMQNHKPTCVCLPEFTGDANHICQQISPVTPCLPGIGCGPTCVSNEECPEHLDCERGICINKCFWKNRTRCAVNAICVMKNHKPVCVCKEGYTGDPLRGCTQKNGTTCDPEFGCGNNCVRNKDCPNHLTCKKGICIDTCLWNLKFSCAMNAMCVTKDHKPTCLCKPGFTGDALVECVRIKPVSACPPTVTCGSNAFCTMQNQEPVCMCNDGYSGDPLTECQKTDELVDACSPSPCGSNTLCLIVDDKPYCKCLPKYVGNPAEGCYHSCEIDFDCSKKEACIEHECQSPCKLCGKNARCEGTKRHRPICKCQLGFIGNPYRECKRKAECAIHIDCPKSKPFCNKTRCVNPCNSLCGIGAKCNLVGIEAKCYCPRPLTGDPTKICVPAGINVSSLTARDILSGGELFDVVVDWATTLGQLWKRLEEEEFQLTTANQPGRSYHHVSQWTPAVKAYTNPFNSDVIVLKKRTKFEIKHLSAESYSGMCRHKQCPTNAKCEIQIKPNGQYIAVCKCLPGYHEHGNQCFLETCSEDHQCVEHKACINSICGDPCKNRCGPKTSCKTINHKPICSCLPGFEGNPDVECTPQKVKPCVLLKICPKK